MRERDGGFVQTVKADDIEGGDALSRGEWEEPIVGAEPDLGARQTTRHLPKKIRHATLHPLFSTRVDRTVFDIRPRRAVQIEAAIDTGEIAAALGGGIETIREIELEMKAGRPRDIYDLALELLEVAPFQIGARSKSDRGYGLIDGERRAPQAQRQSPVLLEPRHSTEEALQVVGQRCLTHLIGNLPAALAGEPEGIHQMRVAARRLRSLLSAAKQVLPEGQRRWASEELRWLADSLGDARSWDSFVSGLLAPARKGLAEQSELELVEIAAEHRRTQAYEQALAALSGKRYAQSILRLLRWFDNRSWREEASSKQIALLRAPVADVAPHWLDRCRRQVRRRSRNFSQLTPAERHRLRIALKKLRYNLSFFASLFRARDVARFVACLKPLQDALGYANDVRVGRDLVRELESRDRSKPSALVRGSALLLGWHERGVAEGERHIDEAVRQVRSASPVWR